ncbi:MAG: gamma-glutamyl-gamma-aminobutyrate hydrolase family protein, partial [Bacteroidales bacterium]|nr:gamma-glutamyl-gamma-aminobutyrate hydrolase family protein [Bacteroidales bacterium]
MTKLRILLLALALLAAIPASAQLQVGVVDKCPSSGSAEGEPNYLKALHRGGNSVVVIPDTPDSKLLASEISSVDLVFLTGGEDINPSYFGEQPSVYLGTVNDRRDSFEFRVIEEALKQGKPIIGTCRGLQVLNVYFGGTLWQDIPSQLPSSLDHRSPEGHPIRLVKGTRLQSLLQADSLFVNTSHHQAVKDIAPQFKVSAVSPDGIVEAFESDVLPIAAFQFHPERLAVGDDSLFTRIYLNLKQLAGEVAASPVLCGTGKLNRAFEELPLGSIKAEGWLLEMLKRQRDGITASLDEIYPQVCGERNGWLGGDGDQWERGPYWIDGLLPMAYILDDAALKAKAQRWVEWTLASQTEDGQFGPRKDYPREAGIQRSNSLDWWPRMVVLKILMQYHNATGDERVIQFMDKYFRYQLRTLPEKPLGNWTRWAEFRAADNMIAALWLYNKTGESYLLELCDILHRQGWDFTGMFLESDDLAKLGSIHCVNLAQGLKEPVIYWQVRPEQRFLDAMARCNKQMRLHNGWPVGMYGGDEALHGNNPVQGSELCSAVELMYSMEEMLKVTGMVGMAEHLERVAFNALPAQNSDDFREHQYFQQANQIHVCRGPHNFDIVYNGTASLFGVLCGYPCCLCNLHQAWPKFTQNLWYRSPDGGFAAMMYAPCSFSAKVGDINIGIKEETCYPMEESIRLII